MESPEKILSEITALAGGRLRSPADLAYLLGVCRTDTAWQKLLTLSFHAKFIARTSDLMKRIGGQAEGYGKLADELAENLEAARRLLEQLLEETPDMKTIWTDRFLRLSPDAMQNLMGLLYDISWIKNREIDHRSKR